MTTICCGLEVNSRERHAIYSVPFFACGGSAGCTNSPRRWERCGVVGICGNVGASVRSNNRHSWEQSREKIAKSVEKIFERRVRKIFRSGIGIPGYVCYNVTAARTER